MTECSAHSVWDDVHSSVTSINGLLEACLAAWGPDDHKVTAITKKRLAVRALKGLEQGQELLKVLTAKLHELESTTKQWERNVIQASKSHMDLRQQLEHTSDDLHGLRDGIRQAEADRLAAQKELERLQGQLAEADAHKKALNEAKRQLEHDLQEARIGATEASCELNDLRSQVAQLAESTHEAQAVAASATGALSAAQQEVQKEQAARKRHEDAVARLTADNLVFMAKLRAAETAAAAATAERDQLVLALEEHKGPWMDEVHEGVERRVKEAMERAEQLEQQQEATAKQTSEHIARLQQQQSDLEAELAASHSKLADLEQQLAAAHQAEDAARLSAEEAQTLAAEAQACADARMAELRVAQDSLKSMREECNERWMSERSARAQLAEQQSQLAALEEDVKKLKESLASRKDELMTQRAVNQQLMLKKEEVEWQLMAAIAKLKAEGTAHSSGSPVSPIQQPMSPCALSEQTAEAGHVAAGTVPNVAVLAPIAVADDLVQNALASKPSPDSPTEQQMDSDTCRPTAASAAVTSPCTSTDLPHDTFSDVKAAALGHAQCGVMSQAPAVAALTGNSSNSRVATEPLLHVATTNNPVSSDPAATPSVFMAAAVGSAGATTEASVAPNFSLPLTAADVLHHVGSTDSVQDMFSLPSLSYGLATLPPPELLVAAANRQLGSCGSLTLCASNSGSMSVGGVLSPTAALHSKGVVLGATGGLMAAFSPLPKASGNSFTAGLGAVFPACATASAVDGGHQMDKGCLGSTLPGLLSQQQHTGRGTVADSHKVTSDQIGSDHHHHAVGTVGGVTAITTMMPGSSINPAEGVAAASKLVVESPIHPMFASSPGKSPRQRLDQQGLAKAADCAAVDQDSQAADGAFKPVEWRDHPTSGAEMMLGKGYSSQVQKHQKRECSDSPASAGQQLHGILLNGHSSKPRSGNVSPARSMHGMSPSGSMKSVRFSFENMDQDLKGTTAGHLRNQELEADDCDVKDTAGSSHSHRSGGSSGLNAQDHAGRHAGIHHDMRSPRKGAGSVKAASCSSPLYRHREDGVLPSWVLQQRREQARAAAQAAAAAMRGTVVDLPLPKRPPVHPVFGTMTYDAAASKS